MGFWHDLWLLNLHISAACQKPLALQKTQFAMSKTGF
jgi:hypothetical protein